MASEDSVRIQSFLVSLPLCSLPSLRKPFCIACSRREISSKTCQRHLTAGASLSGVALRQICSALCCCFTLQPAQKVSRNFSVSFLSTSSNDLLFKLAIGKMKWGNPNQALRAGAEDGDTELSRADPQQLLTCFSWGNPYKSLLIPGGGRHFIAKRTNKT